MPRLTAILSMIVLLSTASLISACSTVAGAGQDVSSAGHAVTGAADNAK